MGLFIWLEHTRFAIWLHESESVFAFPMVLLLHTIGMGLLVGLATVVNLRLLGCIPRVRLAPMFEVVSSDVARFLDQCSHRRFAADCRRDQQTGKPRLLHQACLRGARRPQHNRNPKSRVSRSSIG